jgi:hypothetical protein
MGLSEKCFTYVLPDPKNKVMLIAFTLHTHSNFQCEFESESD